MNPETIKLIQRLLAEIAGIGLLIWGIIFIYRGVAGKITFVMKGQGFGVKLANASPGIFISLIASFLIWYSMADFSITRKTTTVENPELSTLDKWLVNSSKITGKEDYIQMIDTVVGTDPANRFKAEYLKVHPALTLGQISDSVYGDIKYWKLVAIPNIGKDYFEWNGATPNTLVKDSSLMEIWKVSKFYGKTTEEVIQVKGQDKKEAYKELLEMSRARPDYDPLSHFPELSDLYKTKELALVQTPANFSGDIESIGELSLKYYGDKSLWELIVWTNKETLKNITGSSDKLDKKKSIYILHFIP